MSSGSAPSVVVPSTVKFLILTDQGFLCHKTQVPCDVLRLKNEEIQYVKVSFDLTSCFSLFLCVCSCSLFLGYHL